MKRVFLLEIYVKQAASKPGISVLTPVWDLCKITLYVRQSTFVWAHVKQNISKTYLRLQRHRRLFEIYAKSSISKTERNNINEPLLFEPYVKISYL